MSVISMKALLESGVHFGHRTHKWNPAMKPYIFTERNGIHIIDLQKTVKAIEVAYNLVRDTVAEGGTLLFVGTKRQAQEMIQSEATRSGMPYVTERWLGGMLTNWVTMYARIQEMERLEKMRDTGEINRLTKKEGLLIEREINRLGIRLSGVRTMKKLPELLFVVDVMREETAVHEANLVEVPVLAMVDTNCDPRGVDYVIPSNDDAIRAIKLLVGKIADAVIEGKASRKEEEPETVEMSSPAVTLPSMPRPRYEVEVEMEDKDLLGESTLAKIGGARKPAEEAAPADAAPAPAEEAAPVEETAPEAAPAETTETTPVEKPLENQE
jgi:small subunit ribosomal protein S2